jgi:hypothetical protein
MPKGKLAQRTVYAATIVTILAVAGGVAMAAALFSPIVVSGGGNTASVSTAGTIYGGGTASQILTTGASDTAAGSGCGVTGTGASWIINAPDGAGSCATIGTDYVEEVTFTSAAQSAAGTYTDQFVVSSDWNNGAYGTGSDSVMCTVAASGTCSVTIFFDSGVSTSLSGPPVLDAVGVTITGS